jgi:UDP-N-acetyl-D-mannosaminuronic acid dehydrogenase
LIASARRLNDRMPQHVAEQVQSILAGVKTPHIAALGLAYKADVDDVRESPAVTVIRWLRAAGCQVRAYDPHLNHSPLANTVHSLEATVEDADCLLILTDHREFKTLTPAAVGDKMRHKVLIDTRNTVSHEDWRRAGFEVHLLGDGRLAIQTELLEQIHKQVLPYTVETLPAALGEAEEDWEALLGAS